MLPKSLAVLALLAVASPIARPLAAQSDPQAMWDFHRLPLDQPANVVERAIRALGYTTKSTFIKGDLNIYAEVNAPGPSGPAMDQIPSVLNLLTDDAGRTMTVGYAVGAGKGSRDVAAEAAFFLKGRLDAAYGAATTSEEGEVTIQRWSAGSRRVEMRFRNKERSLGVVYYHSPDGKEPEPIRYTPEQLAALARTPDPSGRPRWVKVDNFEVDTATAVRSGRYRVGWVKTVWRGGPNANGVAFDTRWHGLVYDCLDRRLYAFKSIYLKKGKIVDETSPSTTWSTRFLEEHTAGWDTHCALK